jgi:phosphoribosylformylglycinamidine synthase PurS subunit
MARFEVLVEVRLRPGIADPAGTTVARSLPALGFSGVEQVRMGKAVRLVLEAPEPGAAERAAEQMAERLLANTVMEDYEVLRVTPLDPAPARGSEAQR